MHPQAGAPRDLIDGVDVDGVDHGQDQAVLGLEYGSHQEFAGYRLGDQAGDSRLDHPLERREKGHAQTQSRGLADRFFGGGPRLDENLAQIVAARPGLLERPFKRLSLDHAVPLKDIFQACPAGSRRRAVFHVRSSPAAPTLRAFRAVSPRATAWSKPPGPPPRSPDVLFLALVRRKGDDVGLGSVAAAQLSQQRRAVFPGQLQIHDHETGFGGADQGEPSIPVIRGGHLESLFAQ